VFFNAPISNGSSLGTPHKKKPAAAASANAKKIYDEVLLDSSRLPSMMLVFTHDLWSLYIKMSQI